MYNDTIKVANKIIKAEDLYDIFTKMQEKLLEYQKLSNIKERQNDSLEWKDKAWDFKDEGSSLTFNVDFYDDTSIKFDNYNNFISIYNQRLDEIKNISVYFTLFYSIKKAGQLQDVTSESIRCYIYESKMDIEVSLNSTYRKIDDVYNLIKSKILNAKTRYDMIVKKKTKIESTVGFAIAFIPVIIIFIASLFVPIIKEIFINTYVLFPILVLIISYIFGTVIGNTMLDSLYKNIVPEKVYAGYDSTNYKSIYKDDLDSYKQKSEILIGKNTSNLKNRKEINYKYNKYKRFILPEIIVLVIISIIILFL